MTQGSLLTMIFAPFLTSFMPELAMLELLRSKFCCRLRSDGEQRIAVDD
jgi:hypothetical protein